MTVRPIDFRAPMVRALLEGRKTQDRRALARQPKGSPYYQSGNIIDEYPNETMDSWRAPYALGDLLYVREAHEIEGNHVVFAATYEGHQRRKFKPSIHMPRWASRLTLAVTDVRVERLRHITNADAKAEGFDPHPKVETPWHSFLDYWNKLHGDHASDLNPWVVAITFTAHRINVDQFAAPGKEMETAA